MIDFIIPEYKENLGDCCCVCKEGIEEIHKRRINSILKDTFTQKYIDIRSIKHKCSRLLGQKNLIPLYLGAGEILIPLKIREPRVQRDGGYGYINYFLVRKVNDRSVVLRDGREIFFLESKRSIIKRIRMATIIEEAFKNPSKKETAADYLGIPATKEDIAIILRHIDEIKRRMERIV